MHAESLEYLRIGHILSLLIGCPPGLMMFTKWRTKPGNKKARPDSKLQGSCFSIPAYLVIVL